MNMPANDDYGLWIFSYTYFATGEGVTVGLYMAKGQYQHAFADAQQTFGPFGVGMRLHSQVPPDLQKYVPAFVQEQIPRAPGFVWTCTLHLNYS